MTYFEEETFTFLEQVLFSLSNPQPSYFGLLLGWVAAAWLGVMTTLMSEPLQGTECKGENFDHQVI